MCSLDLKCEKLNMNCACNQSHHITTHFVFIIRHVCFVYVCSLFGYPADVECTNISLLNNEFKAPLCVFMKSPVPTEIFFRSDLTRVLFRLFRLEYQCNFINFLKYNINAGCITVIYSLVTALMLNLVFPLERCGALCQYL